MVESQKEALAVEIVKRQYVLNAKRWDSYGDEGYQKSVREQPFATEAGEIPVTLSIGLACGKSTLALSSLIEKADQALYQAKEAGRDQIQTT